MRRELWETIVDLFEATTTLQMTQAGLRVTNMSYDIPVEIVTRKTDVGFRLLVDVPHSRWMSGYHAPPSRLRLTLRETLHESA